MYNSVRLNDSPIYKKKNHRYGPNDSSRLSRSLLSPTITSTPVNAFSMNNRRNGSLTLLSPGAGRGRRGSLADVAVTPPKYLNSVEPPAAKLVQNASGPLLASTQYNINLSTYVDSKSPGFASRIVQYNEERERSQPTHQAKYGSPGSFPVVHLFKKDLPVMSPRPRRVTVRMAPSDCSRFNNTPEHNRLLLEDMMHEGDNSRTNHQSHEVSNRSVLDALKEISRKRIHPGEEYDIGEESVKRLRPDCINGDSYYSSVKSREDSPKSDQQKLCVVDPFYASSASTTLEKERLKKVLSVPGEKTTVRIEEPPVMKDSDVSVVSVETQTTITAETTESQKEVEPDCPKVTQNDDTPKKSSDSADSKPPTKVRKAPPRIFDEKPLEIMRKNRLAVLLGALTGEKPVLIPKEDKLAKFREETEKEEQEKLKEQGGEHKVDGKESTTELKSILTSGGRKSDVSAEKHVTFTFSSTTEATEAVAATTASQASLKTLPSITQTSTSVVTPVVSPSVSDSPSFSVTNMLNTQYKNSMSTPLSSTPLSSTALSSTPLSSTPLSSTPLSSTPSQSPVFGFGNRPSTADIRESDSQLDVPKSNEQQSTVDSVSQAVCSTSSASSSLQFTFGNATSKPASPTLGGFQFGGSTTSISSTPTTTFAFSTPSSAAKAASPPGGFKFGGSKEAVSAATPKVGGFKFDLSKPPTSTISPSNTGCDRLQPLKLFNNPTESSKAPVPLLGNTKEPSFTASTTSSSASVVSSDQAGSKLMFNFGSRAFGAAPAAPATDNPTFNFGGSTGSEKLTAPTGQQTAFAPSSISGGFKFGPTSTQFDNSTASKSEAATTTVAAPTFTAGCTFSSGTGATFVFGNTNTTTAPSFAVATTTSIEDKPSSATTMFGGGIGAGASAFGTTTTNSAFGNVASNPHTGFGNATVNSAPNFGSTTSAPSFGSTTNAPAFGGAPNASVPAFGTSITNVTPTFGGAQNSSIPAFGSTTTSSTVPAFGSTINSAVPAFGAAANSSVFASSVSTTPNTGFGANSAGSMFNATPAMTTASSTPAFGGTFTGFGNKASGFGDGNTATTTSVGMFGGSVPTTSSAFGQGAGFNMAAGNGGSMFGGGTTQSPFGATTQSTPAFGSTGGFTIPSTNFGTAVTTSTPSFTIGSKPAFGTSATPFAPSSTTSTVLGGNSTSAPVFGGASAGSMFGAPSGNPAFGNGNKPLFGSGNSSAFGSTATTTSSGGGFGSGATPTFGFGGTPNTTTNAFGSNTSAFGTTTTANSGFGAGGAAPAFGSTSTFTFNAPTNTTASSSLGAQSNPSFGSSGFGTGGSSSFGSNTSVGFGTSGATGGFGSTAPTTNSFGSAAPNTSASMFGSGGFGSNATSPFGGKPQTSFGAPATNSFAATSSNTFGTSSGGTSGGVGGSGGVGAFGSIPSTGGFSGNQPAQNGVFTFGSSNTQPANTGGFSFGSTDAKPSFNFTAGGSASAFGTGGGGAPAFGGPTAGGGGGGAPAFGGPTAGGGGGGGGAFGGNPAGQFAGAPAMFSIGSGGTPKGRQQLRAKRRT